MTNEQLLQALKIEIDSQLIEKLDIFSGTVLKMFKEQEKRIDARFEKIEARLDTMDARFDAMDERFDTMDSRFDAMDERFDTMDARFDAADKRTDNIEFLILDVKRDMVSHTLLLDSLQVNQKQSSILMSHIDRLLPREE